jgi:hypothetical protein
MKHIILLGDSIFDNAVYVPDRPPVIEQVRRGLPAESKATLVAVDGHTVDDMATQLPRVPDSATHLVVSVGGNDALGASALLREPATTVGDALAILAGAIGEFRNAYGRMLRSILGLGKPTAICTVYDAIPVLGTAERMGLAGFNDVITRAAVVAGLPLLDLRVICNHPDDYSPLSPIEPSVVGGAKIADGICRLVTEHDFATRRSVIYT